MAERQATEDPDLDWLQEAHGGRYYINRVGSLWRATLKRDDGTEPTLVRDTPEELAHAMTHPGLWGQRTPDPRSPL